MIELIKKYSHCVGREYIQEIFLFEFRGLYCYTFFTLLLSLLLLLVESLIRLMQIQREEVC